MACARSPPKTMHALSTAHPHLQHRARQHRALPLDGEAVVHGKQEGLGELLARVGGHHGDQRRPDAVHTRAVATAVLPGTCACGGNQPRCVEGEASEASEPEKKKKKKKHEVP